MMRATAELAAPALAMSCCAALLSLLYPGCCVCCCCRCSWCCCCCCGWAGAEHAAAVPRFCDGCEGGQLPTAAQIAALMASQGGSSSHRCRGRSMLPARSLPCSRARTAPGSPLLPSLPASSRTGRPCPWSIPACAPRRPPPPTLCPFSHLRFHAMRMRLLSAAAAAAEDGVGGPPLHKDPAPAPSADRRPCSSTRASQHSITLLALAHAQPRTCRP